MLNLVLLAALSGPAVDHEAEARRYRAFAETALTASWKRQFEARARYHEAASGMARPVVQQQHHHHYYPQTYQTQQVDDYDWQGQQRNFQDMLRQQQDSRRQQEDWSRQVRDQQRQQADWNRQWQDQRRQQSDWQRQVRWRR